MARELDERQVAIDLAHRRVTRPAPLNPPKARKPRFVSTRPMVYDACETGPCQKGTKLCPSPEACEIENRSGPKPAWLRSFAPSSQLGWRTRLLRWLKGLR
jgi:hypothetical protein